MDKWEQLLTKMNSEFAEYEACLLYTSNFWDLS